MPVLAHHQHVHAQHVEAARCACARPQDTVAVATGGSLLAAGGVLPLLAPAPRVTTLGFIVALRAGHVAVAAGAARVAASRPTRNTAAVGTTSSGPCTRNSAPVRPGCARGAACRPTPVARGRSERPRESASRLRSRAWRCGQGSSRAATLAISAPRTRRAVLLQRLVWQVHGHPIPSPCAPPSGLMMNHALPPPVTGSSFSSAGSSCGRSRVRGTGQRALDASVSPRRTASAKHRFRIIRSAPGIRFQRTRRRHARIALALGRAPNEQSLTSRMRLADGKPHVLGDRAHTLDRVPRARARAPRKLVPFD